MYYLKISELLLLNLYFPLVCNVPLTSTMDDNSSIAVLTLESKAKYLILAKNHQLQH